MKEKPCEICGGFAGLEVSPEGQRCDICDRWICNDCEYTGIDYDGDVVCKKCSAERNNMIKEKDGENAQAVETDNEKFVAYCTGRGIKWEVAYDFLVVHYQNLNTFKQNFKELLEWKEKIT